MVSDYFRGLQSSENDVCMWLESELSEGCTLLVMMRGCGHELLVSTPKRSEIDDFAARDACFSLTLSEEGGYGV